MGRFNESLKFGWNFYCSKKCQSEYFSEKRELKCENCGKLFQRSPHAVSSHNYCSQSCAAIVNNKKYPKIRKTVSKICIKCGEKFKKSTGNLKYCSMKCRRSAGKRTSEQLLRIIEETAQKLKRIPVRRELERIIKPCIKKFGSWNNAISAAGFTPNRSYDNRMYKRIKATALDGHLCDSISELLIDNWLYKNGILHERNVQYPKTHHKADWKISAKDKEIFVEYFGLVNDSPRYDRSTKEKGMLCRKSNISLIGIYPKDIYPQHHLETNLRNKFSGYILAVRAERLALSISGTRNRRHSC